MLKNKAFKVVCVVMVLMIAFASVGCSESAKADGGQAKKAVHQKTKVKLVKAKPNYNARSVVLPKTLYETKRYVVSYISDGVFFYDKVKKKIVKGFMVKAPKHPLHLNGQGSELAWAVTNKKYTTITIFTVGAGFLKHINKEYYVYNIKTGKLKIVKKPYPKKKIKAFSKKTYLKQEKGWKFTKVDSPRLKDTVYRSRIDGKIYKIFSEK